MKRAVVLLSGGIDSMLVLDIMLKQLFECHCLTIDYGQMNRRELETALGVAAILRPKSHRFVTIGGLPLPSMLTNGATSDPVVPGRNAMFLSIGFGYAESIGARYVAIGCNATDQRAFPDCQVNSLVTLESGLNNCLGRTSVEDHIWVYHPLAQLGKAQVIRRAFLAGLPIELTTSCYVPSADGSDCGVCPACLIRADGISKLGGDS